MTGIDAFLLTREWRDRAGALEIVLWGATHGRPLRVVVDDQSAVCFVARDLRWPRGAPRVERVPRDLETLGGDPVDALYFRTRRDLLAARDMLHAAGAALLESDVRPADRYLMERFVTAGFRATGEPSERAGFVEMRNPRITRAEIHPPLRTLSVDVESDGFDGELLSIAMLGDGEETVLMRGAGDPIDGVIWCADERALVSALVDRVQMLDPDLLIGWNVVAFDLALLERRARMLGVELALGRDRAPAAVLAPRGPGAVHVARIPGRVALDGIELLRASFRTFERMTLDAVARELLGRGKAIDGGADRGEEILRLHREDPAALAAYNIEDCRLAAEIFATADLVEFARRRAELTGLALDRVGGSVAAFDHLYLPRLHRRGRVAPDVGAANTDGGSPGGYVLDSRPGLYDNVLVLDFKSLYPSIIRTFRIDPWGLACPGEDPVPGYDGACFARDGGILPELIGELWAVRDEARRAGDAPLAQAVKILMNSFYGVLGTSACRFADARLASSITRRGHTIIRASRDHIESLGREVIYGDTDSLFVLLGPDVDETAAAEIGRGLADRLNDWWRERVAAELGLESCLEIEFETLFLRFLMPTVRGEATGSKKRYAGLVRAPDGAHEVVFKGLESVRGDWTPLARRFQRELYRRVFLGEPYLDYVRGVHAAMMRGDLDAELVYRKRLRRDLTSYRASAPPHVRAARKLARPVRTVRYVVTAHGPEPVVDGALPVPDRAHYRDRQLAPAADGILHFLDTSYEAITAGQFELF